MDRDMSMAEKQPKTKSTYKLKDFIRLITSVNPKKALFALGLFLSLLTSGASLIVPQLTKGLIDTSKLAKIDKTMLIVLVFSLCGTISIWSNRELLVALRRRECGQNITGKIMEPFVANAGGLL